MTDSMNNAERGISRHSLLNKLKPATAGGPSISPEQPGTDNPIENTDVLKAVVGGTTAGKGRRSRGSTPASEGGRPPRNIGRREFLIGTTVVAAGVAASAAEKKFGWVRSLFGGKSKEPENGGAKPITTPDVTVASNTPTPEPTKVLEVILPPYPEKYDFGEGDKYFKDHGGFFTGVERSRAEEPVAKYTTNYNGLKKEWTVNQELFTGIEVDDPVALHKALVIAHRLGNSVLTDKDGKITPEDFDRVRADAEAEFANTGTLKTDKKLGVVLVNQPGDQFYLTQYDEISKRVDGHFEIAELFKSNATSEFPRSIAVVLYKYLSLESMGLLDIHGLNKIIEPTSSLATDVNSISLKFAEVLSPDSVRFAK